MLCRLVGTLLAQTCGGQYMHICAPFSSLRFDAWALLLGLYGRYFYIVPFTVSFNCFYVYINYYMRLSL